jgi:hypothetical protein
MAAQCSPVLAWKLSEEGGREEGVCGISQMEKYWAENSVREANFYDARETHTFGREMPKFLKFFLTLCFSYDVIPQLAFIHARVPLFPHNLEQQAAER